MFAHIRETWQFLKRSPSGERFIRYYRRRQERRERAWQRPLLLIGGAMLIVIGIILMPAPGPGTLIVAAGAAVVAGESRGFAHFLDRAELRVRGWFGRRET